MFIFENFHTVESEHGEGEFAIVGEIDLTVFLLVPVAGSVDVECCGVTGFLLHDDAWGDEFEFLDEEVHFS